MAIEPGFELTHDFQGYKAGTILRDVTLAEARAMECNRCGDCCNGLREDVVKDEATGLPLFIWGSKFPEDLYAERYGQQLLIPIILGDGGPVLGGLNFEEMANGDLHTSFACSFLDENPGDGCETACKLIKQHGQGNPEDISTIRPRNCGEFPVFGLDIDATLIEGNTFIPPTGPLPRCTWHGIRIVGPWKDTPNWRERWEQQQAGKEVPHAPSIAPEVIKRLLDRRETVDGSKGRPDLYDQWRGLQQSDRSDRGMPDDLVGL